ncbi:hypothetical protein CF086_17400 [Clostridium botulinum]|uniref:hypothetical protein n=1 Tax=Clostridium botulinum TaxID=1491 RepID=UPI000774212E|nr:hypothetical protein [Clostridium botulinum]MBN3352074.1 hypothetical protein [Clostridium botulinum]
MIDCKDYDKCTNTKKQYHCQYCERNINKVKIKDYYNYDIELEFKLAFETILESSKDLGITEEQLKCAIDMITKCCENDNGNLVNIK